MRVIVLNGVNLNMLGRRDQAVYGSLTMAELESRIYAWARELQLAVQCRQTNSEGEFIKWCHDAYDNTDGMVVNPAAWTHYAWSIHDALEPLTVPVVEVHLSNVDERDEWRQAVRHLRPRRDTLRRARARRLPDGPRISEGERVNARIERLRGLIEEPLLVTTPKNVIYLAGFDSSNAALLVDQERVQLFTDFRYIEAARAVEGVEVVQTKRGVIGALAEQLSGRIGFEAANVVYSDFQTLEAGGIELVPHTRPRRVAARDQGRERAGDPAPRVRDHRPRLRAPHRGEVRRPHGARGVVGADAALPRGGRRGSRVRVDRRRRPDGSAPARARRPIARSRSASSS